MLKIPYFNKKKFKKKGRLFGVINICINSTPHNTNYVVFLFFIIAYCIIDVRIYFKNSSMTMEVKEDENKNA